MIFKFEIKTEPTVKAAVGIVACVAVSTIAIYQGTDYINAICVVSATAVTYLTLRGLNPAPAPVRLPARNRQATATDHN